MASIGVYNKKDYFARISYKSVGKYKVKLVNLHTVQKKRAEIRLIEINKLENLYKQGKIKLEDISLKKPPKEILSNNEIYRRSWEKVINGFYTHLRLNDKKEGTIDLYKLALTALQEIFKNKMFTDITRQDRDFFYEELKKDYSKNTTFNIRLRCIRAFFNYLVEEGKIQSVPFKFKQLSTPNKNPVYFTDAEMIFILNKIKEKAAKRSKKQKYEKERDLLFHDLIYTFWQTGLRLSELKNSFYRNGYIITYNAIKNGKERAIPCPADLLPKYLNAKKVDMLDKSISRKFRRLLKQKDVKLYSIESEETRHLHNLRHTFATRTYYKTRDIYLVSRYLGHFSVTQSEQYAKFHIEMLEKDFHLITEELKMQNVQPEEPDKVAPIKRDKDNPKLEDIKQEIEPEKYSELIQDRIYLA